MTEQTFLTVRETARETHLSEYALRHMLKSESPPPHIVVGEKKVLINFPKFEHWLDEMSVGR